MAEYGDGGQCEKIISWGRWEGEESADSNADYEACATKDPWDLNEMDLVESKAKWERSLAWTKVWLYSDFNALPMAYGGISSAGLSSGV